MAHELKTLDVTIAIPLGTSHIETRRVQQICHDVETLIRAEYPEAAYIEHVLVPSATEVPA